MAALLRPGSLVVVGGTGFLGKVWLAFVLGRYPDLEQLYLMVRPKRGRSAEQRFSDEVLTSQVFDALRGSTASASRSSSGPG